MTVRYFVQLSFDGKHYHGWQTQPNAVAVQSVIESKLSLMLRQNIEIVGAGRTDTGVHSKYYIAHFDHEGLIPDIEEFTFKLNRFLPADIAIQRIFRVNSDAHARFSALSRTYEYYIHNQKDPFLDESSYYLYGKLDIDKMNSAATLLFDYQDFTSFSKKHSDAKTNNCKIFNVFWMENRHQLIFTIKADRFLRNMVRAIVGSLIDVGKGKIDESDFKKIILGKNRSSAGESVPAKGLFLVDIEYPEWIYTFAQSAAENISQAFSA